MLKYISTILFQRISTVMKENKMRQKKCFLEIMYNITIFMSMCKKSKARDNILFLIA